MSEAQERQEAHLDTAGLPSPGQMLKRERERLGMNLDEVAVQLNLRPAVVTGLEADNYDQVPVAAYRRGYLRAYARLVGIDEAKVVDAYNAQHGRNDIERKISPVHATKPPSRVGAWIFKLVTLLVILGLIGLTLLWWQSRQGNDLLGLGELGGQDAVQSLDEQANGESAAGDTAIDGDATNETLPPLPEQGNDLGLVDENAGDASDQPTSDAVAEDAETGAVEPGNASDATPPADAAPATSPSETADAAAPTSADDMAGAAATATEAQDAPAVIDERSITLVFSEESWTEIFDATDERILVGLQPAGSQVTIEGEPPFRLTIGNATGVEMTYLNQPVDLAAYTGGNNVARFNLGE
ncbi:cytoskeleton protein RodZ [Modicisalibacter muralis]|uniref:Cytoskeleton protein RodZ n=1 Tax=Modicisalibacter muralis TaxID=119000 RepID=A0A1G9JEW6_9GAMM|nr:RodZ domain-containing protein [Halomonas muralis]SDL35911.1 cytoskeleton protein RodZ [Halomonas muralis]